MARSEDETAQVARHRRAKRKLSAALRSVERGARIVITDHGRPIAELVPVEDEEGFTVSPSKRPFSAIRNKRYPRTRLTVDPVALLLVERGDR